MSRLVNDQNDLVGNISPSKLDDLPNVGVGFSACLWIYRVGDPSSTFPRLFDKENASTTSGWALGTNKSTDTPALAISYTERRATTNKQRVSAANVLSNNVWIFVGLTVAIGTTASGIHIYTGSPAGQVAEVSYNSTTNGSGAFNSDAADIFGIGMRPSSQASNFWDGRLAEVRIFGNYLLSLAELQGIMNGNFSIPNPTFYCPIWGVMATEPDLSSAASNAQSGTSTLADHAPVSQPFPI